MVVLGNQVEKLGGFIEVEGVIEIFLIGCMVEREKEVCEAQLLCFALPYCVHHIHED